MPNKGVIFVGGIHGVGKSTFCSKLAPLFHLKHFSAGELIKAHLISETRDKRVKDVGGNQEVLIAAVENIEAPDNIIFLDGHFCVLNSSGEIAQIPESVFLQLSPFAVLLLYDEVSNIAERLKGRDAKNYSRDVLTTLQDAEISHARAVCSSIRVELCVLRPSMLSDAESFIAHQLKSNGL